MIGKLPFTDDRFSFQEFPKVKLATPYLSVPTATINGKVYAQSAGILRYIGKQTGLYPTDDIEALKVDEIVDAFNDLLSAMYRYRGKDDDLKRADRERLVAEDIPKYAGGVEKRLACFSDGPFVLGEKVSIADTALVSIVNTFRCGILDYAPKDVLAEFPRIMEACEAVMALPEVVAWYKKYPIEGVTA